MKEIPLRLEAEAAKQPTMEMEAAKQPRLEVEIGGDDFFVSDANKSLWERSVAEADREVNELFGKNCLDP